MLDNDGKSSQDRTQLSIGEPAVPIRVIQLSVVQHGAVPKPDPLSVVPEIVYLLLEPNEANQINLLWYRCPKLQ